MLSLRMYYWFMVKTMDGKLSKKMTTDCEAKFRASSEYKATVETCSEVKQILDSIAENETTWDEIEAFLAVSKCLYGSDCMDSHGIPERLSTMSAVIDVVFEDSLWVGNLSSLVKPYNTIGIHLYNFTHFIKTFKKNNKRIFYQNSNTVSLVNAITVANFLPNIATKATKTTAFSTCACTSSSSASSSTIQHYLYSIERKNPRIIVWREGRPVKLCSTQIYISSGKEDAIKIYYTKILPYIKARYQKYINVLDDCSNQCLTKQPISNGNLLYVKKSIAVFDLDDTLIDEKNNLKKGALKFIESVKDRVDILVLWSHGGRIHVGEQLRKNEWSDTFDVALFNTDIDFLNCKNLLYLYWVYQ
uniref:Uncharacterized protein n=1 Tax=Tetranychus urticae TaxID=32264 RepID=T1JWY2_TETUR